jgi:hypothetical protein
LAWQIDGNWKFDPKFETPVEIGFSSVAKQTRVEVIHGNLEKYGGAAEAIANALGAAGGWPALLEAFAGRVRELHHR